MPYATAGCLETAGNHAFDVHNQGGGSSAELWGTTDGDDDLPEQTAGRYCCYAGRIAAFYALWRR